MQKSETKIDKDQIAKKGDPIRGNKGKRTPAAVSTAGSKMWGDQAIN
jgi:hypothetical protein